MHLLLKRKLRLADQPEPFGLGLVFFHHRRRRHQRRVHRVKRKVGEERLVAVRLDKIHRLRPEPHGQVLALRAVLQARVGVGGEKLPGLKRRPGTPSALVDVEPLVLRPIIFVRTKVPFASEKSRVTTCLERLRKRVLIKIHPVVQRCGEKPPGAPSAEKIRGIHPCRVLAGHDAVTRRAADRVGGVAVREAHAGPGEPVDVRRLVKRIRIVRTDIHVPHVIDEKEDNIGLPGLGRGQHSHKAKQTDRKNMTHHRQAPNWNRKPPLGQAQKRSGDIPVPENPIAVSKKRTQMNADFEDGK